MLETHVAILLHKYNTWYNSQKILVFASEEAWLQ